jgi:hypothetical protein
MQHLYPRYRDAFDRKRDHFQARLRPGAEVLDVGSRLGAFFEIAETWGWKPMGLDIGRDTSVFARHQGGSVKQVSLEDYSPDRPDATFIWNCFEELVNPWDTIIRAPSSPPYSSFCFLQLAGGVQRIEQNRASLQRCACEKNCAEKTSGSRTAITRTSTEQPF